MTLSFIHAFYSRFLSILIAAGLPANRWVERGIAMGGMFNQLLVFSHLFSKFIVIIFVTILHGFAPKMGVVLMNVCILDLFQSNPTH